MQIDQNGYATQERAGESVQCAMHNQRRAMLIGENPKRECRCFEYEPSVRLTLLGSYLVNDSLTIH